MKIYFFGGSVTPPRPISPNLLSPRVVLNTLVQKSLKKQNNEDKVLLLFVTSENNVAMEQSTFGKIYWNKIF